MDIRALRTALSSQMMHIHNLDPGYLADPLETTSGDKIPPEHMNSSIIFPFSFVLDFYLVSVRVL